MYACNMLSAIYYALNKARVATNKIYTIYAEYNMGDVLPSKIYYTLGMSNYKYYLNARFTSNITSAYKLGHAFPYAVKFAFIPKINVFEWTKLEENKNED